MSLSTKEKELVAVGASIAAGCRPCTNYHFKKARAERASDEEIKQAMTDAIAVRDRARELMESLGFRLLGLKLGRAEMEEEVEGGTSRMTELVSVASAFAVNCKISLKKHLERAGALGIAEDEIEEVLELAEFIKGRADSYCCKVI
jgi:AhpD family alkylhydroperoxidase